MLTPFTLIPLQPDTPMTASIASLDRSPAVADSGGRLLSSLTPARISGALLVLGSLVFLGGGRLHPHINTSFGPMGSDQFFLGFAQHVLMYPAWEAFHTFILLGPVIWALASPGVASALPRRGAPLWAAAQMVLGMAATLWTIAFVLDGYNAPIFARAITTAPGPEAQHQLILAFRISANTMTRLGLVAWTMISLSFAVFSVGLMASARALTWRAIVGGFGILIGIWPIVAIALGEFIPGPFTSQFWTPTALITALWIALFGIAITSTKAHDVA